MIHRPEDQTLRIFCPLHSLDLSQVIQNSGGRLVTVSRMLLQQPEDNVTEVSGNQRVDGRWVGNRRGHMMKDQIAHSVSRKWHAPGQTFKEQNSQRVQVR